MEKLLRKFFLFLSNNKFFTKLAKKYGLRFGASRFVAGETIEQAADAIRKLNQKGLVVTLDHLGEFVNDEQEARERTEECVKAIKVIADENLDSQLSLKMTSMGLDISRDLVMENMRKILDAGQEHGVFVTIDMEDYERSEATLDIFEELKQEYEGLGTVLQSYLYRTEEDLERLDSYNPNLRLVKGAYKESPQVAYPDKKDVDENYKNIIKIHLLNGNYTAIATHDDAMIDYTKKLVKEHGISNDQFEFQMLYGIRTELQEQLVKEGYTMRVYVPYGKDWFGYNMRRLAERPANVAFVLKGIIKK
ncbi:proline dehydrogenase family protein [Tenuibacillus multivorans]|uniref:proline dehydrogenase n=1 Tax=Tenuibacillus multivorans TaxID=237069 RepID=A0A1H0DB94_9BACI|nr:proline dehydrogenase [Tenuibacillus multivorans]GEL76623.1 proline dehydrogenase [Tenuibacillus multivorans]SDN67433.1 proline dehydrogenase [Tenuibacillus multivorans]